MEQVKEGRRSERWRWRRGEGGKKDMGERDGRRKGEKEAGEGGKEDDRSGRGEKSHPGDQAINLSGVRVIIVSVSDLPFTWIR